jgi:hypothetical protein
MKLKLWWYRFLILNYKAFPYVVSLACTVGLVLCGK